MMKQETSKEKNPLSTESASDFSHTIDQTLDQLENISPWELDNFDKALMQWSDQVPFGQSEFQNRYYVVQSHVTPWRQMRQAIMELQARTNSLQKVTIQYRRNLNDIARLEAERDAEENEFERYDIECQIEICKLDTQVWLNKLRQCKDEIEQFLRIIKERSGNDDIEAITKQFDDHNIVEAEEHKYWIARMAKQSAIDLLTTGRIQAGNLEYMLQMNPEDQAAVTDLALTYSTALNHCIGKFKANAEEKVESMLEGRPPEMFDTAGVFTDYVENNVADRRLQSANKPKT